jgi:hypothetical protein
MEVTLGGTPTITSFVTNPLADTQALPPFEVLEAAFTVIVFVPCPLKICKLEETVQVAATPEGKE